MKKLLSPKKLVGDARRKCVRVITVVDDIPIIGRVTRPITQLSMRLLFDGVSNEWTQIRRNPCYEDGLNDALNRLPKRFNPKRILDASCGTGLASAVALERWPNAHITGVDISQNMIDVAEEAYPKVAFFRASVHDLPFADERFDLIIVLDGMIDIPELLRVLSKKGTLLIVYSRKGKTPISKPVKQVARMIEKADGKATTYTEGPAHVVLGKHSN